MRCKYRQRLANPSLSTCTTICYDRRVKKTYDYVLLDWDGNLAKTLDAWLVAIRQPLVARGIEATDAIVASCFGATVARFEELGVKDIDAAIVEMDIAVAKLLPEVDLYPDALVVLEALREAGKKTALISTSPRRHVLGLLEKHHISHLFDVVLGYEDTKEHKPHPEPLLKALRQLGGKPQHAVMIGDTDKDILAGRNAGVDSILFFPKEHHRFYSLDEFKSCEPMYIVTDLRRILDII